MIAEGSDIDTDYLSALSNDEVSEVLISIKGVKSGDTLGDLQWTPEVIPPSVHCTTEWVFIIPVHRCKSNNVQHVVNATGLSTVQDLNYYTAYAFMNIISPQDQAVKMGVGSDDAIKVWLNGAVVHRNNADRKTSGIQDKFDVNLEAGNNPLLVKVNDNMENWGMFFKIYLEPTEYKTSIYMTSELPSVAADVNEDGQVDIDDLILVIRALGQTAPINPRVDVNSDGSVDKTDLLIIVENLDDSAVPAAPALREALVAVSPETLQTWLNLLQADSDGSVVYHKTLAILQGILAAVRPHETALLPNYPNPFNPETWIPYQLSKPAAVTLHIYAVNGTLVRQLSLGHQAAGVYQNRSRAAYWDGKNEFGEPVASGVYFYTFTAGDFTATRKMLIRK
ncbi:T9SS type A sorting domain-containing protein [Candidatus Poribacteria bacterium]|nr:T9SS type A sorting domain-containing protein [Candidatus Poribacteria bacterium]